MVAVSVRWYVLSRHYVERADGMVVSSPTTERTSHLLDRAGGTDCSRIPA
jgi:hypothetical protein